jgi:hypothetical protein
VRMAPRTAAPDSIPEKLLQVIPGVLFSFVGALSAPDAFLHVEIFAEVGHVFVVNEIGPALAALLGHRPVVMDAVQADLQVRAALVARLVPAGIPGEPVFPSAMMAMANHEPAV